MEITTICRASCITIYITKSSPYMAPLKQPEPTTQELVISQIRSFNHYMYHASDQSEGAITERDIQQSEINTK